MEEKEKLVTLAIHSVERAQELQQVLADNGIESIIQHVGDTIVTHYVRVRVKESDLDKATALVEDLETGKLKPDTSAKMILVPIDFDNKDFNLRICDIAFKLAQTYGAQIEIFNTFLDPTPHLNLIEEMLTLEKGMRDRKLQDAINSVQTKRDDFDKVIKQKLDAGELPKVDYTIVVRMGVAEEEILKYSQEKKPMLIVMGSKSKAEQESELIGSITAEVLERSAIPVFALPKQSTFKDFANIKKLVYATRFEDDDLLAFDQLMNFIKPFKCQIHILHLGKGGRKSDNEELKVWNEIKLRGIREYLMKHYPEQDIIISLLEKDENLSAINKYIEEENIDVVSLTTHQRSLFVRLFNPSTAKTLLNNGNTPLLVFHV